MPTVMLARNPMDSESWTAYEVDHTGEFLLGYFKEGWPETAHVYADSVAVENDVTPTDDLTIEKLESYPLVWVVVYPAGPLAIGLGIAVVALAASLAVVLLVHKRPSVSSGEKQGLIGSPTNSLTPRDNTARPEQRIPDNFGTKKTKPDLVAVPYIRYENHRQVETALYCIGVGEHEVLAKNVRDGATRIDQIQNASAHVYSPGNAPTGVGPFSGDELAIGDPIVDPALNVYQISAVNGQSMEPVNSKILYGAAKKPDVDAGFNYTTTTAYNFFNILAIEYVDATHGILHIPYLQETQYVHDRVSPGDILFLFLPTAEMPTTGTTKPALGTGPEPYTNGMIVTGLTDAGDYVEVAVTIPAPLAAQWALVPAYVASLNNIGEQQHRFGISFDAPSAEITSTTGIYTGPFFVDFVHPLGSSNITLLVNFVAPQGAWVDDGKSLHASFYEMVVGITPCDVNGIATGAEVFYLNTLEGSDRKDGVRALSMTVPIGFNGRFLIRARREKKRLRREELPFYVEALNYPDPTNNPHGQRAFTGTIQDEIRWTEAYSLSEPPNISFGDVTLVHTRTVNTDGATKEKSRSLNILCTRRINTWNGTTFTGPLVVNADVENVLFWLMKDIYIGNRPNSQIDFPGIAAAALAVREYFNSPDLPPTSVSITLDDNNQSFEETIAAIAQMSFLTLYRQGNVLKAKPDLATDASSLLFNFRNILAKTQKITHLLGATTENDSVEVDYTDPVDGTQTHVHVPVFGNTLAPLSVKIAGLGTRKQALWHAMRAYNQMQFQRQTLEMQCTQEAYSAIVKDRVMVADVTQLNKQTGEVRVVSGLSLQLSQRPVFIGGKIYTIFLQHPDATVESIVITAGTGVFDVVLSTAPSISIVTDASAGVPTLYTIVQNDDAMPRAYLLADMSASQDLTFNLTGYNYSDMYYQGDGLDMWIKDTVIDYSPSEHLLATTGGTVAAISDPTRGLMLSFSGANYIVMATGADDSIDVTRGYTIFAWLRHNSQPGVFGGIVQTLNLSSLQFGVQNNSLAAGHNGTFSVTTALSSAPNLHSVAVTYDPGPGLMKLFLDGVLISHATGVAIPSLAQRCVYGQGFSGVLGDIMRFRRALTDFAILELHQKTQ